jgi:hypothetical protein
LFVHKGVNLTIEAKIVADSISQYGDRITTLQLRYPKFIHGEFLTHRQFSRNSSSTRAIPVKRMIEDIQRDPVMPSFWGKNQKGMSADEETNDPIKIHLFMSGRPNDHFYIPGQTREETWLYARDRMIDLARSFDEAGYHKQIIGRLLEPWYHINTVVTSTQWSNFFALRRHPAAQPEMKALADAIWEAMQTNTPQTLGTGEWHLPYVTGADFEQQPEQHLIKMSVARCARVSYMTHELKTPTAEEDFQLYERLLGSAPIHASPAEHQATPDTMDPDAGGWNTRYEWGNFEGWRQFRKSIPNECIEDENV